MEGRNLFGTGRPAARPLTASLDADERFEKHVRTRLHRGALVAWPWKVLLRREGDAQVYDLTRDPDEQHPRPLGASDVPGPLRQAARVFDAELRLAAEAPEPRHPLSAKMRARLRALGYAR
jgi:hypothetical protein